MAVTKKSKIKASTKVAKNRRKGMRGKPKGASGTDDKINVFIKAEKRRVEEEYENDIAPTVEKTRAAASTTGRTRSQRSGVLTMKEGVKRHPIEEVLAYAITRGNKGTGITLDRTVKIPGVPGGVLHGDKIDTSHNFDFTPMTDLPSSGAGRASARPSFRRPPAGKKIPYEGTPNTAETKFETQSAPQKKIGPQRGPGTFR